MSKRLTGKKRKRGGKPKHPLKPYLVYYYKHRDQYAKKRKYQDFDGSPDKQKIKKRIFENWRNMDSADEEREEIISICNENVRKYKKALQDYHTSTSEDSDLSTDERIKAAKRPPRKKQKKKKKPKDPNAPKRALTSFFLFSKEHREGLKKIPEFQKTSKAGKQISDVAKIQKEMGRRWKTLTDDDKKPYEKEHSRLKAIYMKNMAAYKQKLLDEKKKRAMESSDEDEKPKKRRKKKPSPKRRKKKKPKKKAPTPDPVSRRTSEPDEDEDDDSSSSSGSDFNS